MSEQSVESVVTSAPVRRLVSELIPQPGNPRVVNDDALAKLVESVSKFGVEEGATCAWQPVIVNVHPAFRDQIVGGEMRWRATRAAGIERVWAREVSIDAEGMRELTIRLNVAAGEWDWEKLGEQCSGDQLSLFGVAEYATRELAPKMVPVTVPVVDADNARNHDKRSIEAIAASLKRFGQRKPIVLQRGTNVVVAGEGTLRAAVSLGWAEIAVAYASLSEEDRRDYALADNRAGELSSWDAEQLSAQLSAIEGAAIEGARAKDVGWNQSELQRAIIAPPEFKKLDPAAATGHTCPKCGYEWNG